MVGRMVSIPPPGNPIILNSVEVSMEKDSVLTFELSEKLPYRDKDNLFYFKLIETPLKLALETALTTQRPETVAMWQLKKFNEILIKKIIWIFFGLALLINLIRFSLSIGSNPFIAAIELLVLDQISVILICVPLWIPTMCLVARSYGNAQILSLLEELQTSKVQFTDKDDVDEFDSAPAPIKEIKTRWGFFFNF
jgi:hypothetical protein